MSLGLTDLMLGILWVTYWEIGSVEARRTIMYNVKASKTGLRSYCVQRL